MSVGNCMDGGVRRRSTSWTILGRARLDLREGCGSAEDFWKVWFGSDKCSGRSIIMFL